MKNCLTPKNPKMCNPKLATPLKMRPHYGQSSRVNATPSSGTSPLASYKEVFPPELLTRPLKAVKKNKGPHNNRTKQKKNRHSCNFCENRGVGER